MQQKETNIPSNNPPENIEAPTNKKITPIFMFIAVFMILLAGAGAYFLGVRKGSESRVSPIEVTPTKDTNIQPTNSADPTIDWELYKSSKGDYTFKHPAGLKSDTGATGAGQESIRFTYISGNQGRKEGMLSDGYSFVVTKIVSTDSTKNIAQKERNEAEKSCQEMTNPSAQISTLSNILVDNNQSWQFTIRGCLVDSTTIFTENNNTRYRITLNYPGTPERQEQYKATLNQILSTFKFSQQNTIQPTSQTQNYVKSSSWSNVNVANRNISLCLPPKWEISEQHGNIVFNRDPAYKPDVAQISMYDYKGGSRKDEYINLKVQYEYEPDKLKSETKVSDISINGKSVLRITIPSFPEALVFVENNKLYAFELSAWDMVNASQAAFNKDIYTVIGCVQPI